MFRRTFFLHEPDSLPLQVTTPNAEVVLEPDVHVGDVLLEAGTEVFDVLPLVIPPLGNPAPEEVQAELQAASDNFCPRRSEHTNKGVPPLRYTAASPTNLILTHSPLNLLHCYSAVLRSPLAANFPRSHKEAMARPEAA